MFEKLEARYPYGRYAQQAQLEVAYAYYKSNEQASAVAACERFIKLHPNHPNVDYAYYLKGLACFSEDLGLLGRWPTRTSPSATRRPPANPSTTFRTLKGDPALPRQQIHARRPEAHALPGQCPRRLRCMVAPYYLKRGAYVAAASRAQATLRTSPRRPLEEALAVMMPATTRLGHAGAARRRRACCARTSQQPFYCGLPQRQNARPWWNCGNASGAHHG